MGLSQERDTKQLGTHAFLDLYAFPVKNGVKIFKGALVVIDSSGRAKPGVTETGDICVGRSEETYDNTAGADGDIVASIRAGSFTWDNGTAGDAILAADVGQLAFVIDDHTVGLTDGGATRSIAGTIVGVDPLYGPIVLSGITPTISSALAAEIAARSDFEADIASTANGEGASMVGVEDPTHRYGAGPTTVESALATPIDAKLLATVADNNLTGGVDVVHKIVNADAASGHTDFVLVEKFEIFEVTVVRGAAAGGAGDTIKLQTAGGAADITDAIDLNAAAKTVKRVGTIDLAQNVIAAAGTLRVTWVKATNVACSLYIRGIKRA